MAEIERNRRIDFLRGLAICLVVLGHTIQYGSGTEYLQQGLFYSNILFKIIYSFHMPLFMMISGYLFSYTVEKYSLGAFLRNRFDRLLIPIAAWGTVMFIITAIIQQKELRFHLVVSCIRYCIENNWFLWAIVVCSMIVYFIAHFCKDSVWVYIPIYAVMFITPDAYNFRLYKFVFPFFALAYAFHRKGREMDQMFQRRLWSITVTIIYLLLLWFYNRDCYIYTTGFTILNTTDPLRQFGIDLYRIAIGLAGIFSLLLLLRRMQLKKESRVAGLLCRLGRHSLGIYLLSGIMAEQLLVRIKSVGYPNVGINLLQTLLILVISDFITALMTENRTVNKIFLGGR